MKKPSVSERTAPITPSVFEICSYRQYRPNSVYDRFLCLSVRRRMTFIPPNAPYSRFKGVGYKIDFLFQFAFFGIADFIAVPVFKHSRITSLNSPVNRPTTCSGCSRRDSPSRSLPCGSERDNTIRAYNRAHRL